MITTISNLYKPYINFLKEKLSPSGNMVCMERAETRCDLLPILYALNNCGFQIDLNLTNNVRCIEGTEERGLALITCRNNGNTSSELIEEVLNCSIQDIPYGFSGIYAKYLLEHDRGKLIDSFITIDDKKTICSLHAVYYSNKNINQFILYQQNKNDSQIQYFDVNEDWAEMLQLMEHSRINDRNNGFSTIDFSDHLTLDNCLEKLAYQ